MTIGFPSDPKLVLKDLDGQAMRPRVSVIIPTQRRPGSLRTAMRSVLRQSELDLETIELVVVDNDQVDSARGVVSEIAAEAPFTVTYVHEPHPGVASARNAAVAKALGQNIAFLDDDEEADERWLAQLLAVQSRHDADAVFGPVRGRAPPAIQQHRAFLEAFFSRTGPAADGVIGYYCGCGNSLVRRAALPNAAAPFNLDHDGIGGEDDCLFGEMKGRGARFAWAAHAVVWEDPVPARLTLAYTLPRGFAYGQGATQKRARRGQRLHAAWSIVSGAGQAGVFGALAAVAWAVRWPRRAFLLDQAAKGLGKVLWWSRFHIRFYGLAAVPETNVTLNA